MMSWTLQSWTSIQVMGVRYYQRLGKGGGFSMPIWMLPIAGVVWLFTALVIAAAWLAFQILRLVGLGGVAAVRSARERRKLDAARSQDPAYIASRAATQKQLALEQADREKRSAQAREEIPNLLPRHWAWRALLAGWALLWVALGLQGVLGALSASDRSLAGPILGPLFVIGLTVVLPLWMARGLRRRRIADALQRGEAAPIAGTAAMACEDCGRLLVSSDRFCQGCGTPNRTTNEWLTAQGGR
jgi:hypothetical protein